MKKSEAPGPVIRSGQIWRDISVKNLGRTEKFVKVVGFEHIHGQTWITVQPCGRDGTLMRSPGWQAQVNQFGGPCGGGGEALYVLVAQRDKEVAEMMRRYSREEIVAGLKILAGQDKFLRAEIRAMIEAL